MLGRRLHPDETLISSLVLQISTWVFAIMFLFAIALSLLYHGKYKMFIDWITGGWRDVL